jgi:hypothetical protein
MPWNSLNTLKTPVKKAGGGITLSFDSMTGVTLHTGTPGWKVYTISSTTAMTRTITASVLSDTTINIVVCGGGGGSYTTQERAGGGGGGRFREASKLISALTPTQTFTCTIPARANGNQVGGTSSITFSVPSVGDIYCGGGGIGLQFGGSASNAPANGGGGGGGGYSIGGGYNGGAGVFGGNGGRGYSMSSGINSVGGGGGAGGAGGNAYEYYNGAAGAGVSTTLAGVLSVYNSSYKFCSGGSGGISDGTIGSGAQGAETNSVPPLPSTSGGSGAIIIAVPA